MNKFKEKQIIVFLLKYIDENTESVERIGEIMIRLNPIYPMRVEKYNWMYCSDNKSEFHNAKKNIVETDTSGRRKKQQPSVLYCL